MIIETLRPDTILAEVKRINKKAKKKGLPLVKILSSKTWSEKQEVEVWGEVYKITVHITRIELDIPELLSELKVKGVEYVAKVERGPAEDNYVFFVEEKEDSVVREKYGTGPISCDHCGKDEKFGLPEDSFDKLIDGEEE